MERLERKPHNQLKTAVRISAIMLTAPGLAYVDLHLAEAQTTPCVARLIVREQFFQDKGGETFQGGRPRFQPNIDEILGPAPNRRILVEATKDSRVLVTDNKGIGIDQKNNTPFAQFSGPSDAQEGSIPALKLRVQQLNNGDSIETIVACNRQKTIDIMSDKGPLQVERGLAVMPQTREIQRTPGTEVQPTAERTPIPATATPRVEPSPTARLTPTPTLQPEKGQSTNAVQRFLVENIVPGLVVAAVVILLAIRRTRRVTINTFRLPDRLIRNWLNRRAGGAGIPLWP